jgi:putative FmdB family regulatory protein
MPTYEYICAKCGHEFEKYQSMADKALTTCLKEVCAEKKWARGRVTRKISTGGGLIFKGSGFYTTDYRSEGYKQAAKKDTDSAKPATPAAAPGSDGKAATPAKPAAKSESKPAKAVGGKS